MNYTGGCLLEHSVEVNGKCGHCDVEIFLNYSHKSHIVLGRVPVLTTAHSHTVASVLSNERLHHVLVTFVKAEIFYRNLGLVGKLLRQGWQLIRLYIICETILHQLLDDSFNLLHRHIKTVNKLTAGLK